LHPLGLNRKFHCLVYSSPLFAFFPARSRNFVTGCRRHDVTPTIRMLIRDVLIENGNTPLEAGDGPTALKILRSNIRIDLMITDVGLPGGMNGRQVADAARISRPHLKVPFITGYAENAVVGNGHLEPGNGRVDQAVCHGDVGQQNSRSD
jgi:CheY-like chemotaxis protein